MSLQESLTQLDGRVHNVELTNAKLALAFENQTTVLLGIKELLGRFDMRLRDLEAEAAEARGAEREKSKAEQKEHSSKNLEIAKIGLISSFTGGIWQFLVWAFSYHKQ